MGIAAAKGNEGACIEENKRRVDRKAACADGVTQRVSRVWCEDIGSRCGIGFSPMS
jgi:hypothetical protein